MQLRSIPRTSWIKQEQLAQLQADIAKEGNALAVEQAEVVDLQREFECAAALQEGPPVALAPWDPS